jgi:probable F420-dependent oxidoreductase
MHVPQWGPDASRDGVLDVAAAAEKAGLDSIWVADHVVFPAESASRYPYDAGGTPFAAEDGFLEAFITLAVVAGATETLRIGTSVLVLPMRDPVLVAKMAATLDVLSNGRLSLGIGIGWWREEFAALSVSFSNRGARLDEQLQAMRALWSGDPVQFSGAHYQFDEISCSPAPIQPGGPPILIGGKSPAAIRRAARHGNGWHAVGVSPEDILLARRDLAAAAEEAGRDPAEIIVTASTGVSRDLGRTRSRLHALAEAGVELVVLAVASNEAEAICENVEKIGVLVPEFAEHPGCA